MTRTGSIPYSCSGIESNYVLSDKLHNLDPTTLTFQNPKLTLWHLDPETFADYNNTTWSKANTKWEAELKTNDYFNRVYFPCDVSIVILDSLLQSNHPKLSNPSNLLRTTHDLLKFWDNQRQQFNSPLRSRLNHTSYNLLYEIHRNHLFKIRLQSASWLERASKILAQSPSILRFK